MSHAKVPAVCPHRFLMVKGIDHRQSVETFRCYHCGTPVIRPFPMTLSTWFSFPRKNLHLIPKPFPPMKPKRGTAPPPQAA
jgi:hypothetical protein